MSKYFKFLLVILIFSGCGEYQNREESEKSTPPEGKFDSLLARKLGADDYGMKRYVMAFLKRGPVRSQDSIEASKLQRAHLDNIHRMAEEGKLIMAGPFLDTGDIRGIYIFDVRTVEEARALTSTDPAIKAGRLEMELHPWYGPAMLMNIVELQEKVTKKGF